MNAKSPKRRRTGLPLLWVSPEVAPYASTGGLAEVAGALPPRLHAAGHDVRVLFPYYRSVRESKLAVREVEELRIELGPHVFETRILEAEGVDGTPLRLLDCDVLYDRSEIYGRDGGDYSDNAFRFGALCVAAVELSRREGVKLIHVHDWPTALIPVLLGTRYRDDPELAELRTLLSIHNLAHQGMFGPEVLGQLGLPPGLASYDLMGHHGAVSWLKGGMLFADRLATVSPRYAREIRTAREGRGLEHVLDERAHELSGILNGIDVDEWNPRTDDYLASRFERGNLKGKSICKAALQEELGLDPAPDAPLIIFIGRLAEQKGVDILIENVPGLVRKGAQLAVLGTGDRELEEQLRLTAARHRGSVAAVIDYNRALTHRMLAGGDMLVMPSRFEPCGLSQMQAMRYGTLPIVHAVGGLADTVRGVTTNTLARGTSNGFVFRSHTSRALAMALGRAIELFAQPRLWERVLLRSMAEDWSWDAARPRYQQLYTKLGQSPVRRFSIPIPEWLGPVDPAAAPAPEPYIDWGPPLPERYHEDAIHLMVQSPTNIYVYWELAPERYARVGGRSDLHLRLRVQNDDGSPRHVAELGAGLSDLGDWWIPASPAARYAVELTDAQGNVLLASNQVRTPRATESERSDARWLSLEMRRRLALARALGLSSVDELDAAALAPGGLYAGYPLPFSRADDAEDRS